MAEKYSSWDKKMLTFTVPSTVVGRTIKNGRYTKLRYLLKLRAFIAKEINNSKSDIKYFMNIELGKAYSNPHLHIQVWTKNDSTDIDMGMLPTTVSETSRTSSRHREDGDNAWSKIFQYGKQKINNIISAPKPSVVKICQSKIDEYDRQSNLILKSDRQSITSSCSIDLIKKKAITKFNLNKSRCITTVPEKDISVYHYVIKDYAKGLSDKEIWDLETQKKRMRSQMGSRVRFYSKSGDVLTKRLYRIAYYCYGVMRDMADEFLIDLKNKMFYFTKRNLPQPKVLELVFSYLGYIEQGGYVYVLLFIFYVLYACLDPPFVLFCVW